MEYTLLPAEAKAYRQGKIDGYVAGYVAGLEFAAKHVPPKPPVCGHVYRKGFMYKCDLPKGHEGHFHVQTANGVFPGLKHSWPV
jgi:hypothetical protein